VVFFDLGLSVFGLHLQYNGRLIAVAALACLVARAAHVYVTATATATTPTVFMGMTVIPV
jgi:hypothetical protein